MKHIIKIDLKQAEVDAEILTQILPCAMTVLEGLSPNDIGKIQQRKTRVEITRKEKGRKKQGNKDKKKKI